MNTTATPTTATTQALPAPASACAPPAWLRLPLPVRMQTGVARQTGAGLADRCAGPADRQAGPLRCPSHAVSRARQKNRQKEQRVMATGPHLDDDGHTLVIPSQWYNKAAATFWRQYGFYYNREASTWERDTRLPLTGKRYTAEVWLESTRKQFYQFWPTLLHNCERCGKRFARINRYQTLCDDCTRQRQEVYTRHFSY